MAKKASATPDPRFEVLRMLTEVQKDKLLLKLFRKDPLLVEKLAFEFFEDKSDLNKRVNDIKQNYPLSIFVNERWKFEKIQSNLYICNSLEF